MIPSPSSDRYELSPLQEGMLFHALDARASGVDMERVAVHVEEDLDVPAFRRAWERVVARHAVLRTRFRWEGLERPQQEVCPSATLPLSEHDWSRVPAAEQEGRWAELSLTERQAGFDLSAAPVMRLVVV